MVDRSITTQLLDAYRAVGDKGTRGWKYADRTGWLRDANIVGHIGEWMTSLFPDEVPTVVIGPESSGLPLAALAAASVGAGYIAAQKQVKKLSDSDAWIAATTPLDYQGRNMTLAFRKRLVSASDRVLIVDDWADTGGQLLALHALVELAEARLIGTAVIVDGLSDNSVRRRLGLRSLLHSRDLPD